MNGLVAGGVGLAGVVALNALGLSLPVTAVIAGGAIVLAVAARMALTNPMHYAATATEEERP